MWWHSAETRFRLSAKRTSPFKSAVGGGQFSRLLAAEVCVSAVEMLDTPCSEVVWRVLATHFHSPVSTLTSPPVRHRVPSHFNWSLPHSCTLCHKRHECRKKKIFKFYLSWTGRRTWRALWTSEFLAPVTWRQQIMAATLFLTCHTVNVITGRRQKIRRRVSSSTQFVRTKSSTASHPSSRIVISFSMRTWNRYAAGTQQKRLERKRQGIIREGI